MRTACSSGLIALLASTACFAASATCLETPAGQKPRVVISADPEL